MYIVCYKCTCMYMYILSVYISLHTCTCTSTCKSTMYMYTSRSIYCTRQTTKFIILSTCTHVHVQRSIQCLESFSCTLLATGTCVHVFVYIHVHVHVLINGGTEVFEVVRQIKIFKTKYFASYFRWGLPKNFHAFIVQLSIMCVTVVRMCHFSTYDSQFQNACSQIVAC